MKVKSLYSFDLKKNICNYSFKSFLHMRTFNYKYGLKNINLLSSSKKFSNSNKLKGILNMEKYPEELEKFIENKIVNNDDAKFHDFNLNNKYYTNLNTSFCLLWSEYRLFKNRVEVEISWLKVITKLFKKEIENRILNNINDNFSIEDFLEIKEIEKVTNHDVKAVEYFIKNKLKSLNQPKEIYEMVHFCCTSEDINNISLSLMMKQFVNEIFIPMSNIMIHNFASKSIENSKTGMISRTHGQPATPTTFGKELANFTYRLNDIYYKIQLVKFKGKFNGAVGNFNAHISVRQDINWIEVSKTFIEMMGLEFNPYTTQIENHDSFSELMFLIVQGNNILLDFIRDMLAYDRINYFENKDSNVLLSKAESNIILSNSLLKSISSKLQVSRFQRDLSDSTSMRNFGVIFSYNIKAFILVTEFLEKVKINLKLLSDELDNHWELLAEPMQTILRHNGFKDPYELLKEHTRGKKFNKESYMSLIKSLNLPMEIESKLLSLTPSNYLGNSVEMSNDIYSYLK